MKFLIKMTTKVSGYEEFLCGEKHDAFNSDRNRAVRFDKGTAQAVLNALVTVDEVQSCDCMGHGVDVSFSIVIAREV